MKRKTFKKRGRPKGTRNTLNQTGKEAIKYVGLTCNKCKRYFTIRTSNVDLYTDELKKNWICVICN